MLQVTKIEVKSSSILWSLMMPVQKTCGHCATPFLVPPRRSETVKFCSIECKNKGKRVTLTCSGCGCSFERVKSADFTKYCSNACYHAASKGTPKNGHVRKRHDCICEHCAAPFQVILSRKDTARFCSRTCQSESPVFRQEMSEAQRGEKGWRWSGGLYQGKEGYVRVKGHRLAAQRFHLAHRLVVEKAMIEMEPNHPFLIEIDGRKKLDRKIEVHHIDLNRSNNAFANLLAVTKGAHARIHHKNRTPDPWECWPHSHVSNSSPPSAIPSKDDSIMKEIP